MERSPRARRDRALLRAVRLSAGCALAAVCAIAAYLTLAGLPALAEIGPLRFLLGGEWAPGDARYGILSMLLSSLAASLGAVALAAPISLMGAVFLLRLAPAPLTALLLGGARLLAGLPSVIYGLLGMTMAVPAIAALFPRQTAHNGGATLLAAVLVLASVVLPGLLLASAQALGDLDPSLSDASAALGARGMQTIFMLELPASRPGVWRGRALGAQRAVGEAMAVLLVSGNVANMPGLFESVRLLPAGMVLEMGYAAGLHRMALFSMGLILLSLTLLTSGLLGLLGGEKRP